MLGIPYEHVNENQWSHQWCRVPMPDGSYWICDAYGLYCGPEPAPYQHPCVLTSVKGAPPRRGAFCADRTALFTAFRHGRGECAEIR